MMDQEISRSSESNIVAPPRRIRLRRKIAFALIPLLALLLVGELGVRIHDHALFSVSNAREGRIQMLRSSYPAVYDSQLGYIPRPNTSSNENPSKENFWQTRITIDQRGLRAHKRYAAADQPSILAAGDSFTFGDGEDDDQTWPAHLEEISKERVWNSGVFGYGVDQAVLRSEQLLPTLKPERIVIAFYPGDIGRCEMSIRWAKKPYFRLKDGELSLQNVPVPPPDETRPADIRNWLGHSYLLNSILTRVAPEWWLGDARMVAVHSDGAAVAEKLLVRLAKEGAGQGCKVLVVALTRKGLDEDNAAARKVLAAIGAQGVETLYLNIADRHLNRARHFNNEANLWIAEQIHHRLQGDTVPEAALD